MRSRPVHRVPFEDEPDAVEADLRAQIARLHAERHDLVDLIERQRIDGARKDAEIHRLQHRIAHLERQAQKRRWPW